MIKRFDIFEFNLVATSIEGVGMNTDIANTICFVAKTTIWVHCAFPYKVIREPH